MGAHLSLDLVRRSERVERGMVLFLGDLVPYKAMFSSHPRTLFDALESTAQRAFLELFFFLIFFIYLFIGCVGSSFLCKGFL